MTNEQQGSLYAEPPADPVAEVGCDLTPDDWAREDPDGYCEAVEQALADADAAGALMSTDPAAWACLSRDVRTVMGRALVRVVDAREPWVVRWCESRYAGEETES